MDGKTMNQIFQNHPGYLYKEYQDGLAKINKLHKEIHELLKEIRDKNLEEYP